MFNFFTWSIRHTIIVTVLLALLPLAGIIAYSSYDRSQQVIRDTEKHLFYLTESIASQEELVIKNSLNLMLILESSGILSSFSPEKLTELFSSLVQNSDFLELFLVTPRSIIIASASNKPFPEQAKKLVFTAIQQGELSIGDFLIGNSEQPTGIYSAMPIKNEQGEIDSVLIVCTPILRPVYKISKDISPYIQVRFADRHGRFIRGNYNLEEQSEYNWLDVSELALLRNQQVDSGVYSLGLQNQHYLVAYRRLYIGKEKQPYLYVLLDIPQDELYGGASSLFKRDLALLLASVLLAILIAWILSTRTLLLPLKMLINTASRFGKGDLSTRAEIGKFGGEFKSLAYSFNHMAVALEIRNQQLLESKKAADSGNKAKSSFLANMSHEIRTPMNAIIGLAYLALQTEMSSKLQSYVNKIYASANSLLQIINDILDFSKVESGKLRLEEIPFRLEDIFNNLSNMLTPQAEKKGLKLEFYINSNVPPAMKGDPLRLGQILINLTTNAIKFTSKGRVSITCEIKEFRDEIVRLLFTVEDTGIGMGREAQAKLFKAFSQGDDSTTRRFGGTGLGLVISKHLAEMMQGDIFIISQEGQGTTIKVELNLALAEDSAGYNLEVNRGLKGVSVLVVEDDEASRITLVEMLKRMSMRPTAVASGEKALQELENMDLSTPYKVILMDWKLPNLNGAETTQKIKELGLAYEPIVIMVTAYGRNEIRHHATASGVDAFLHKPVTPSLLYNTIQDSLAQKSESSSAVAPTPDKEVDFSLAGSNLLLVEDNIINQQVALELLTSKDAHVDVAENGKVALEMLLATKNGTLKPYDLVLMDLQMPVMDGLEATHHIRADSHFAQLPIIAMTAHAMQAEHDNCRDAGMNDHIAKPIDVAALYRTISYWLNEIEKESISPVRVDSVSSEQQKSSYSPAKTGDISKVSPEKADAQEQKIIDAFPAFDISGALRRVAGNTGLYLKILTRFTKDYASKDVELRELLSLEKKEAAILLVHSIKGLSGNLGMSSLFEAAKNLEDCLRQDKDLAGIEVQNLLTAFLLTLQQSLNQVNSGLDVVIDKSDGEPKIIPKSTGFDPKKCVALREALSESDSIAQELFQSLEQELRSILPEGRLGLLRENIENFEFDEASQLLDALLPSEEEDSKS